jgi:hypothetical protein
MVPPWLHHSAPRAGSSCSGPATRIVDFRARGYFRDKRVRNYTLSPTVYDHNTFMKVWLAE